MSFMRKMMDDNKPIMDVVIGSLLWVMIIMNVASCVRWAQDSHTKRLETAAAAAAAAAEAAAQETEEEAGAEEAEEAEEAEDEEDEDEDCYPCELLQHDLKERDTLIEELEEALQGLREENAILKGEVDFLKKHRAPRKVIGMKILSGSRREITPAGGPKSLEDQIIQAVKEGWEIYGAAVRSAEAGNWYQTLLRYEAEPVAPTSANSFMLDAEQVAAKIRGLSKEWRTARQIQKALEPAPPHKTPFASLKTVNSVLYTMLNKGEVQKGGDPLSTLGAPLWKMV